MFNSYRTTDIIKTVKTTTTRYDVVAQPFAKAYGQSDVIVSASQVKAVEFTSKKAWMTVAQYKFANIELATTWINEQATK